MRVDEDVEVVLEVQQADGQRAGDEAVDEGARDGRIGEGHGGSVPRGDSLDPQSLSCACPTLNVFLGLLLFLSLSLFPYLTGNVIALHGLRSRQGRAR